MKPEVSVLMSVYNGERWLAESIESVLNQTFTDFEFLIVNDGSTDGSGEIINRYAEQDSRIHVFDKPNTGLADSLNYGIARAKGEWIARIDADDVCEPERLESQWGVVSTNPDLVFVGSGLVLIDAYGNRTAVHHYPTSHRRLVAHLTTARKFPVHSSVFFRAEAFRQVGGYRSRIRRSQDWDLWLRFSEVGKLTSTRKPLVHIRKHAAQISHEEGGTRQKVDSRVAIVSYWLRQRGLPDPVNSDDESFEIFREWVRESIDLEGQLQREGARNLMKLATNGSLYSRFRLIRYFFTRPGLAAMLIRERFFGSSLPMDEWMRDVKKERVVPEKHMNFFNINATRALLNGQRRGRTNGARLFALMMLKASNI